MDNSHKKRGTAPEPLKFPAGWADKLAKSMKNQRPEQCCPKKKSKKK